MQQWMVVGIYLVGWCIQCLVHIMLIQVSLCCLCGICHFLAILGSFVFVSILFCMDLRKGETEKVPINQQVLEQSNILSHISLSVGCMLQGQLNQFKINLYKACQLIHD